MPAFEMYSVFVKAASGLVVAIPPQADFAFPTKDICDAVTNQTRMVLSLADRTIPTGQLIPRDTIRDIARGVPPEVTIVLDEFTTTSAAKLFCRNWTRIPTSSSAGRSPRLMALPGCAPGASSAIRIGSKPIRQIVPPYSLSVFATAGWRAALRDREYLGDYHDQV